MIHKRYFYFMYYFVISTRFESVQKWSEKFRAFPIPLWSRFWPFWKPQLCLHENLAHLTPNNRQVHCLLMVDTQWNGLKRIWCVTWLTTDLQNCQIIFRSPLKNKDTHWINFWNLYNAWKHVLKSNIKMLSFNVALEFCPFCTKFWIWLKNAGY